MKTEKTESAEVLSEDQAAEHRALTDGAAGAVVPGAVAEVSPADGLAVELVGIAGALLAAAAPMFPSVKAIYTDEVTKAAAASIAAVCVKHGWLSGGLMGEYAEEMMALMVCGPLALATVQAVKSDLAAMKKPTAAPSGTVGPEPEGEAQPVVMARG